MTTIIVFSTLTKQSRGNLTAFRARGDIQLYHVHLPPAAATAIAAISHPRASPPAVLTPGGRGVLRQKWVLGMCGP